MGVDVPDGGFCLPGEVCGGSRHSLFGEPQKPIRLMDCACGRAVALWIFLWRFNSMDPSPFFKSLYAFGEGFAFNGSVHALLRVAFGGIAPATMSCAVLLAIFLGFGFFHFHPERNSRYQKDPVSGIFYSLGSVILLVPTVHFWYLGWIVPFLVLRPSRSWLMLCLTIAFYFVAVGIFHHTGAWHLSVWGYTCEWLPFFLALTVQAICFLRQMNIGMKFQTPESVSVVIPALNEASRIAICVRSAMNDPSVKEVIVVDGGSVDRTCEMALSAGAGVVSYSRSPAEGGGRGGQIWAGIKQASGHLVAIVHADSIVKPPAFTRMCGVLAKEPRLCGGALGSVFENQRGLPGLIGLANELRMVLAGISFGDQVQFFRREPVVSGRIFPRIPLMEDVEFCIRLYGLGPQIFLFGSAVVSSRRWKARGLSNAISVVNRVTVYLLMRLLGRIPDTGRMYQRYYRPKE